MEMASLLLGLLEPFLSASLMFLAGNCPHPRDDLCSHILDQGVYPRPVGVFLFHEAESDAELWHFA